MLLKGKGDIVTMFRAVDMRCKGRSPEKSESPTARQPVISPVSIKIRATLPELCNNWWSKPVSGVCPVPCEVQTHIQQSSRDDLRNGISKAVEQVNACTSATITTRRRVNPAHQFEFFLSNPYSMSVISEMCNYFIHKSSFPKAVSLLPSHYSEVGK